MRERNPSGGDRRPVGGEGRDGRTGEKVMGARELDDARVPRRDSRGGEPQIRSGFGADGERCPVDGHDLSGPLRAGDLETRRLPGQTNPSACHFRAIWGREGPDANGGRPGTGTTRRPGSPQDLTRASWRTLKRASSSLRVSTIPPYSNSSYPTMAGPKKPCSRMAIALREAISRT